MSQKLNYDFVFEYFKKHNCELLEEKYINSKTKMRYKCSCGNISYTNFNKFQQGRRCKHCGIIKSTSSQRFSQEHVEKYFREQGCKLEDTYINTETKVRYRCVCGNYSEIKFSHFKNGHRCQECRRKKISGSRHHSWINNREEAELRRKIRKTSHSLLKHTLDSIGKKKTNKTYKLLGYNKDKLLEHLQHDPHYKDWVKDSYTWHIDHIIPIHAFTSNGITDIALINKLENLRILHKDDNLSKHMKYNKLEFQNYLNRNGVVYE